MSHSSSQIEIGVVLSQVTDRLFGVKGRSNIINFILNLQVTALSTSFPLKKQDQPLFQFLCFLKLLNVSDFLDDRIQCCWYHCILNPILEIVSSSLGSLAANYLLYCIMRNTAETSLQVHNRADLMQVRVGTVGDDIESGSFESASLIANNNDQSTIDALTATERYFH